MGIFPHGIARLGLVLTVVVTVGLSGCLGGGGTTAISPVKSLNQVTVSVSWDSNPPGENVLGYRVYFAKEGQPQMSSITDTSAVAGFDAKTPVVIFNAVQDLGVTERDSSICFGVRAYNAAGASPMSEIVCKNL